MACSKTACHAEEYQVAAGACYIFKCFAATANNSLALAVLGTCK